MERDVGRPATRHQTERGASCICILHPAQGSGGSCVDVGGGLPSVVGGMISLARLGMQLRGERA